MPYNKMSLGQVGVQRDSRPHGMFPTKDMTTHSFARFRACLCGPANVLSCHTIFLLPCLRGKQTSHSHYSEFFPQNLIAISN